MGMSVAIGAVGGSVRPAYIGPWLRGQFAAGALVVGLASAALAEAIPVDARMDVAYGPLPSETGDLYTPAEPRGRKPAVLLIHGGGWVEGSRQAGSDLARMIAAEGAVVFNIDYRLADQARPETRWPAQLVDAQLAVRFLRAHAEAFGIDPARIGAMGDSAGAQLAVFLGVLPRIVPGDGDALYPGERPDVQAVVDQFGPTDLPGMGSYAAGSIAAMFGVAMPSGTELLTASPIPSVTSHSAPLYILHGEADQVVPFQQSRQLQDTLRAHDVAAELVPFAGGHEYRDVPADTVARLQTGAVKWLIARLRR